ncbi:IS630 family transposase [Geobacillus thermocatenulatus]|uniref:IS630 family transposase n=2 Tax=Geobacillus thermocatenulatus TaxID=33938 RepID=UPI000B92E83F|nr:IS630 family transposase [Geobacillus thermocatenulatus]ASS98128.1 IS630 family transposase [Geobacillus thermocatenulatus]
MITKETEDAVLLYIDETHIRSYHVLRSTWSEVGRQKQVPAFGHHAHVSRFGAVNIHDGETVLHPTTAAHAATFLDFLRMLKERDPDRLIILVLDHARIHHANMVKEFWREEGPCFHFLSLPPYSSQLNPIERLWKWLKDTVIANVFHQNRDDIVQAIARFVDDIHERPEEVLQRLGCAG